MIFCEFYVTTSSNLIFSSRISAFNFFYFSIMSSILFIQESIFPQSSAILDRYKLRFFSKQVRMFYKSLRQASRSCFNLVKALKYFSSLFWVSSLCLRYNFYTSIFSSLSLKFYFSFSLIWRSLPKSTSFIVFSYLSISSLSSSIFCLCLTFSSSTFSYFSWNDYFSNSDSFSWFCSSLTAALRFWMVSLCSVIQLWRAYIYRSWDCTYYARVWVQPTSFLLRSRSRSSSRDSSTIRFCSNDSVFMPLLLILQSIIQAKL